MRAENSDVKFLTCPTCGTEVCFNCRNTWHGENVSCKDALQGDLEEWVTKNKDNVSFCPCCKTRIEKNMGCNHMTCGFCSYEFCWACGGSASHADRHFSGNGCGVEMMDTTVKPGDHLRRFSGLQGIKNKIKNFFAVLCGLITLVILYPLWLVFFAPIMMCVIGSEATRSSPLCGKLITILLMFMLGLILDICFIPLALCGTTCFIFAVIIGIIKHFCLWVQGIVTGR